MHNHKTVVVRTGYGLVAVEVLVCTPDIPPLPISSDESGKPVLDSLDLQHKILIGAERSNVSPLLDRVVSVEQKEVVCHAAGELDEFGSVVTEVFPRSPVERAG
ncbi:hypothetical protein [Mycobacterium sp.]|uniref:hypothetical protein n=1 Tax=Mycobacterium sp. TaxID=1785 RepID=UPI003F9A4F3B